MSTGIRPSIAELKETINWAHELPETPDERSLALAVYRSLAGGRPVTIADLARTTGFTEFWIEGTLDGWPGVFRDDDGRIVAFWGLAIPEMAHRFDVDGRTLYTWCAFDPLFIAPLLGTTARVTSVCPVTGATITLTVGPDGIRDVEPASAVLSFLRPTKKWGDDVIETFCHYVLLFASPEAAEQWVTENPDTFVLPLDEAQALSVHTLGRLRGSATS